MLPPLVRAISASTTDLPSGENATSSTLARAVASARPLTTSSTMSPSDMAI